MIRWQALERRTWVHRILWASEHCVFEGVCSTHNHFAEIREGLLLAVDWAIPSQGQWNIKISGLVTYCRQIHPKLVQRLLWPFRSPRQPGDTLAST